MDRHVDKLRHLLPDFAADYLEAAFAGDSDAADRLILTAPNRSRGLIVRAMYDAKVPADALRTALSGAWDHDHHEVLAAAATWRRFVAMFRRAAFPIPDLPATVTIWRGGRGRSLVDVAAGISWTLNRDVACWFACVHRPLHRPRAAGHPIVVRMAVPRRVMIYWSNDRGEQEVIPATLRRATIDGDPDEWRARADLRAAEVEAALNAPSSSWRQRPGIDPASLVPNRWRLDELGQLIGEAVPGRNPAALARVKSLCAKLARYARLNGDAGMHFAAIEARAAALFGPRPENKHPGGPGALRIAALRHVETLRAVLGRGAMARPPRG
jgi:hypothetical protein